MPELPEIEHLRRTLRPRLVGAVVIGVELRRPDIVRSGGREAAALLAGSRIINLVRHGKNLAIRPIRDKVPDHRILLAWSKDAPLSPATQALMIPGQFDTIAPIVREAFMNGMKRSFFVGAMVMYASALFALAILPDVVKSSRVRQTLEAEAVAVAAAPGGVCCLSPRACAWPWTTCSRTTALRHRCACIGRRAGRRNRADDSHVENQW